MTSSHPCVLVLLAGLAINCCKAFDLPLSFDGLWSGTPSASILGPFDESADVPFVFGVTTAEDFYVLGEDITYDADGFEEEDLAGWQRFYIERNGADAGALWYCGALRTFGPGTGFAGAFASEVFRVQRQSNSSVTFCFDDKHPQTWDQIQGVRGVFPTTQEPFCSGCSCGEWVFTHDEVADTLLINYETVGTTHLRVLMKRVGAAPVVKEEDLPVYNLPGPNGPNYICNFEEGKPDSSPLGYNSLISKSGGCPFSGRTHNKGSNAPKIVSSEYEHCYTMNRHTDFRLEWNVDTELEQIHYRMSARFEDPETSYVALGWRPLARERSVLIPSVLKTGTESKFGMQGADIAVGHAQGVRTMYAEEFAGRPVDADYLSITKVETTVADGRLTVDFTRPFTGGKLLSMFPNNLPGGSNILDEAADMMWAVGTYTADGDVGPGYHSVGRGYRYIVWEDPSDMDLWSCDGR